MGVFAWNPTKLTPVLVTRGVCCFGYEIELCPILPDQWTRPKGSKLLAASIRQKHVTRVVRGCDKRQSEYGEHPRDHN